MRRSIATILVSLAFSTCGVAAPLPRFPPQAVWNLDVSQAPLSANSTPMLAWLESQGGWGTGLTDFRVDFSFMVLHADWSAAVQPLVQQPGYYAPDCDGVQPIPLPLGGGIEGTSPPGYTCDIANDDCHLLVVRGNSLFESFKTTVDSQGVESVCLAIWNLDAIYPPDGRGDGCTSADAAGFPIAPLLFNADEVAAAIANNGDIGHAIRFILPNPDMRAGYYVRPASHIGGPSSTNPLAIPYGSRLRLKATFDISPFNPAAQVVLRTLKKYGMVLADGGNLPLTAETDDYTTAKWADLGFGAHSLSGVRPSDFEIVDSEPLIADPGECTRSDRVFANGFDG